MPAQDNGSHRAAPLTVGIVGGGQLARMLCEAALPLGISTVVLAQRDDDAAVAVADRVVLGGASDRGALSELVRHCAVVTFDHEQVDLGLLAELEDAGAVLRPGSETLAFTVDKSHMRRTFAEVGIPVPAFAVLPGHGEEARRSIDEFGARHGWPLVLKASSGGYDGKGVWIVGDAREGEAVLEGARLAGTTLLVEEHVAIERELSVMVARGPDGSCVSWPAAQTLQVDGVCREVLVPGGLRPELADEAAKLAHEVAERCGVVGALAVEMFASGGRLVVNELAARPHNSGHWSIEGAVTSQFENHLRAVLDLPLGDPSKVVPEVASVNVFGAPDGTDPFDHLGEALAVPGAHVHLYGKGHRPGRKLGHVTVCGSDDEDVRRRAWRGATILGTAVPKGAGVPR